MLRIGLVGCGTHGHWAVVPAIQETAKDCCLAAACDLREENLAWVRDRYPEVQTFADYRRMFAEAELDAAYIATLSDTHFEPTVAALQAGLHVVCEKPMADTLDKCRTMIDEAAKAGRLLAIVFENRYHPYNRQVREWIAAGHLGRVEAIHFQDFWDGHKNKGPLALRRARFIDRTGALDCGIHQLDLMRYFLGGEWQEIHALGTWFGEPLANAPHLCIQARLTTGAIATMNSSLAYGAYIEPKPRSHVMTVVGDKGVINYCSDGERDTELKLVSETLTEVFPHESVGHNLAIGWLLDEFAQVVEGKIPRPPELATGHDGLMAQIIVEETLAQARRLRDT